MDSEIVDAVIDWDSTAFSGGYEGLREFAAGEFSGAITEGTAWAFMLNGRVIGIEDGSMSAFERAEGTAYTAPTPALPLLYVMQMRGEKQTQYYTNEKPISEADNTLSSGGFTGYIELSENVLSGDYYTVYYGGKSMSVAFVGNSEQLLTDEEAFERADDEVGIYTVYAADVEVTEIPEPAGTTADTTDSSTKETTDSSQSNAAEASSTDEAANGAGTDSSTTTTGSQPASTDQTRPPADDTTDRSSKASARSQSAATSSSDGGSSAASAGDRQATTAETNSTQSASGSSKDVFNDEAEWRDSKTIPSLDPSDDPKQTDGSSRSTQSKTKATKQKSSLSSLSRKQLQKRLKRAEKIMQKAEAQHEKLVEERDSLKAERDEAQAELESVRAELAEAEAEIERLESQLESGSASDSTAVEDGIPSSTRSISTTEALEGTNFLIRYDSKGDGTLADAISGSADQEAVQNNLRIEPHTTFDSEQVSVDGQPFETFLDGRIELAFVRWLAEEFLFDIQQTGNTTHLKGIYEALPAINRAELRGNVSLGTDEDGNDRNAEFDLVVRDKRDRPLFVADFNESKQPVGSTMVDSLVRDGSEIIQRNESFAAGFAVTTSYYEGDALDAAADATGGGLLSASRGKSFVYISRKQGFHLCLVERLGDTFDLHVPEL